MVNVYRSTVLGAPADRVWRDLRDFNGLANWHPAVVSSRIENGHPADKVGCVRSYQFKDGGRVREKLLSLSDYDYACIYTILESPLDLTDHTATLRLLPVTEGNRCFVEWSAEFTCATQSTADLAAVIGEKIFQRGFDALKKRYGER